MIRITAKEYAAANDCTMALARKTLRAKKGVKEITVRRKNKRTDRILQRYSTMLVFEYDEALEVKSETLGKTRRTMGNDR
jgi:hypothetical protein